MVENWIGYELHPETPPAGKPLASICPGPDADRVLQSLRAAGAPYGVGFNRIEIVVNSRLALEASEFARDRGRFAEIHTRLFQAYFQEGQNIGEKPVILRLLRELGLDENEFNAAHEQGLYLPRLQRARELGREYGITAVPTFVINGKERIIGAQAYRVFQRVLENRLDGNKG
ncbi:MAG: DsbA family protein [Bacillota bacterium]